MIISHIDKLILGTEDKWLRILFANCKRQFSGIHLPSHDHTHHLRVWQYAKFLLQHLTKENVAIAETDIESLIVSVFFHDLGMVETCSCEHGKISRHMCKVFFDTSQLSPPPSFEEVLQAVENHDQKDYSGLSFTKGINLQKLLNIADDLDAIGIIGAYRYLEIYLLRQVEIATLPDIIATNLDRRFQYFTKTFGIHSGIVESQYPRYLAVRHYFNDLQGQFSQVHYDQDVYAGPMGVVNYIRNEIIQKKQCLPTVKETVFQQNDVYCIQFFDQLAKEMVQPVT
jgi:hypothetical protein